MFRWFLLLLNVFGFSPIVHYTFHHLVNSLPEANTVAFPLSIWKKNMLSFIAAPLQSPLTNHVNSAYSVGGWTPFRWTFRSCFIFIIGGIAINTKVGISHEIMQMIFFLSVFWTTHAAFSGWWLTSREVKAANVSAAELVILICDADRFT